MLGRVLPCASGGICPDGSTTAITSGVGVNVSWINAAATSAFRSRRIPNPLMRTPTSPTTASTSTAKRIRSITRRRFDTGTWGWSLVSSSVSTTGADSARSSGATATTRPVLLKCSNRSRRAPRRFSINKRRNSSTDMSSGRFTSGHGEGIIPQGTLSHWDCQFYYPRYNVNPSGG